MGRHVIIIGELATSFNFLAAGESEEHVCDVLRKAWEEHVKQTGASGWENWQDAVNVYEIPIGGAIRDGQPIIEGVPAVLRGVVSIIVDTEYACPGCGQRITAVQRGTREWYTECGGEGEGGCQVWVDDDPVAVAAHMAVMDKLKKEHS